MNEKSDSSSSPPRYEFSPGPGCGVALTVGALLVWITGVVLIELIADLTVGVRSQFGLGLAIAEIVWTLLFAIAFWWAVKIRDILGEIGLRLTRLTAPYWIVGAVLGAVGVAIALGVIEIGGKVTLVNEPLTFPKNASVIGTYHWAYAVVLFAIRAAEEEIITRGVLYPLLKRSLGFIWTLALSSLVFSLFHLVNNAFSIIPFVDIFLAGVFLALLRELTGNLWLACGAHFGWNFALVLAGVPVSGLYARLSHQFWHFTTTGPVWLTGGEFGPEGGLGGVIADLALICLAGWLLYLKKTRSHENPLESF